MLPEDRRTGEKVRDIRQRAGLSLDELAVRAGISKTGLWQVETGRSEPGISTVRRIATALGIAPSALVDDAPGPGGPDPETLARLVSDALRSLDFYRRRCDAIQEYQRHLPEPHRTVICNILANGKPHP